MLEAYEISAKGINGGKTNGKSIEHRSWFFDDEDC